MQPHVQRMHDERAELAAKCDALLVFNSGDFFLTLPKEKQTLLNEQYAIMRDYLDILDRRLYLE